VPNMRYCPVPDGTEEHHEKPVSETQGQDLNPGLPEYTQSQHLVAV